MFSIHLKELRQKHNLSQKEFAAILKVSTGTVGNWEVGLREPDFKMLVKIADIFNVPCDYLLDRYSDDSGGEVISARLSVTPLEEEMLFEFRNAGKKFGKDGQQAIITITKTLNEKIEN